MSLHYLLDGYNIIHQVPKLMHGSLEERRCLLIAWLNHARPQGSVRNQVTVVFDGHKDHFGGMASGDIRVIFSDGQNADDCIKAMIEDAQSPKNFIVVSDDKEIKLYTRALGAHVLSVREFAMDLYRPKNNKGQFKNIHMPSVKHVSLSQTDKINKELSKIWIK